LIHISIPVHNEERTVGVLLWKIRKVMAEFGRDYQVTVLDDASTDNTPAVLDRYRRVLPLQVIRSEERLGYGPAMERLLREAAHGTKYPKRDVAVTLQADFTDNPEDLVPMVKAIEGGADLVVGSRSVDGELQPAPVRMSRWLAGLVLGRALRDAPVSDPFSAFRAYRIVVLKKAFREEARRMLPSAVPGGWASNLQILSATAPHARRIEETPIRLRLAHRSRESRFRPVRELRSLLPLRGRLDWPPAAEEERT
jgi:glycosyltransferase involved in cell wall biosynthesis